MLFRDGTRSLVGRWLLAVLLALLAPATADASRIRPVNLEEMIGRSATIVAGRCLDVATERHPDLGLDVTRITLQVDRTLKGRGGPTLTVRMAGADPAGGRGPRVAGLPAFRRGEEVILFLYGESTVGLTSPVGLGQGKFTVVKDKQGRRIALNGDGNRFLFRGLSPEAVARLGGTPPGAGAGREVRAETLLQMIESLARNAPAPRQGP
jgi:hypothetical protein